MTALYETLQLGVSDLHRVQLPTFQRGFVWSKQKRNEFVETLHRGFPFGTFLVYPESNEPDSVLLLLDGQQRLSTIIQYQKDPLQFWKPNNRDEYDHGYQAVKDELAKIDPHIAKQWKETDFDELISEKTDLADWADDVAPDDQVGRKALRELVKRVREKVKGYVNLDELSIFAIKYTGSKDAIADVFTNLNKGGMPLSKYEIFNAAWLNEEIKLLPSEESNQQGEILRLVKKYYEDMSENAEFDLNNFSEDELTATRSITLSELCIALGSFVQEKLGSLVPDSRDSRNEIGFGLLGIATGIDNRRLELLNTKTNDIRERLQQILEKVETISCNLQEIFGKLLKRISAKKGNEYALGLSTTFKTLSYFAALWDINATSPEYKSILKNIPAYYVFDSFSQVWSSHGDQRLLDYYPGHAKRDYSTPVDKEQFKEAFARWLSDAVPGINFSKEVKAVVTIHANLSYLSSTVPHGDPFELEHIIAKKRINEADNSQSRAIYGSSLGNCMYLPKSTNGSKKDKTLYEANIADEYSDIIPESFYFSEGEFEEIFAALKEDNFDVVNDAIFARGEKVGLDLIDRLLL